MVHLPVAVSKAPTEGDADCSVTPAGSVSAITTPLAGLGPRFVTRTVKMTVSPTSGSLLSTDFSTARSAAGTALVVAALESFAVTGSGSVSPVLTARFVNVPGPVTVARMSSRTVAPDATSPTVHVPVVASYAPGAGTEDTNWSPAGRLSVTSTAVAGFGPWFSTVTVTVIVSPTRTPAAGTDVVTSTSASRLSTVVKLAELFAAAGCGVVLETVAVLTKVAVVATVAGTNVAVIVRLAPGARVPRSHGNCVEQAPVFETNAVPDGAGSATDTRSAFDGPLLVTVSV